MAPKLPKIGSSRTFHPVASCFGRKGGPFAQRVMTGVSRAGPAPKHRFMREAEGDALADFLPVLPPAKGATARELDCSPSSPAAPLSPASPRRPKGLSPRVLRLAEPRGASRGIAASPSAPSLELGEAPEGKAVAVVKEVQRVLQEELAGCRTAKAVKQLLKTADRVITASASKSVGISGKLACRLRDLLRELCGAMGLLPKELLSIRREITRQATERTEELNCALRSNPAPPPASGRSKGRPRPRGSLRRAKAAPVQQVPARGPAESGDGGLAGRRQPGESPPSRESPGRANTREVLPLTEESRQRSRTPDAEPGTDQGQGPGQDHRQKARSSSKEAGVPYYATRRRRGVFLSKAPDPEEKLWQQMKSEMLSKAFRRVQEDGHLFCHKAVDALEVAGFPSPHRSSAEMAIASVSGGCSTLDQVQFFDFVTAYQAFLDKHHDGEFHRFDKNKSGFIEREELSLLLEECGVKPMKCVLNELLLEVDEDDSGHLDSNEFRLVMDLIRIREGFTRKEYDTFVRLFEKYDSNKSGDMDTTELQDILHWLGFPLNAQETALVVSKVDIDKSGTVNKSEFIVCMRHVREKELTTIRSIIEENDGDRSGTLGKSELHLALKGLGYHPEPGSVREALEAAGIEDDELGVEELWQVLKVFRATEGFTAKVAAEAEQAFRKFDIEYTGELGLLSISKAMRWLGYPVELEFLARLVASVDLNASGGLSLPEFMKLLRFHNHNQLELVKSVFAEFDTGGEGYLARESILQAIDQLGLAEAEGAKGHEGCETPSSPGSRVASRHMFSREEDDYFRMQGREDEGPPSPRSPRSPCSPRPDSLRESPASRRASRARQVSIIVEDEEQLDLDGFVAAVTRLQQKARRVYRENGGFSLSEVRVLKQRFRYYDADSSGDIGKKELVLLIEENFPSMAHDKEMRPALVQMMREVDVNQSGNLDFHEFVHLMQRFSELQLQDARDKEQNVRQETNFHPREVEEFRELFLENCEEETRKLSERGVMQLLRAVCPLGHENANVLRQHMRHAIERSQHSGFTTAVKRPQTPDGDDDEQDTPCPERSAAKKGHLDYSRMDFPEFLLLMHRLLEVNFADIKTRTRIAAPTY